MPIEFKVTEGEAYDSKVAPGLIDKLSLSDYIIADKGYNSEAIREQIRDKQSVPITPSREYREMENKNFDWCLYRIALVCAFIWLPL